MRDDLERIMTLSPAWDKRDANPAKNYGIHGVELKMVLKGSKGAVQFLVMTGWVLPHNREEMLRKHAGKVMERTLLSALYMPLPVDVGYHSPTPMFEGQQKMETCDYVEGGCYCAGSRLRAQEWFDEKLLVGGSDAIWDALEEEYAYQFETVDAPATA